MLLGRKIIVVGAGIGGLTAGLALAHRGAQVRVLEQAPALTEVGAGLQISPNGARVLEALGLAQALASHGIAARAVALRDGLSGRDVARLDLLQLPEDQRYVFLHRADLIDMLATAARQAGVQIDPGQSVTQITRDGQVHLREGDVLEADLAVAADGLHSGARATLNGQRAPFFTGQVAWRCIVPNNTAHPMHARVHMGPGRHLVSYPLRDGHSVNIVAVEERRDWVEEGWHHQDDPVRLRAAFAEFDPEVHALLAGAQSVHLWGLFRHKVAHHWCDARGRLALLGDAAHPTLPFLAQGANMAMEDAWVLAACLAGYEDSASALMAYQTRRKGRVTRVIAAANGNAWKYHLRRGPIRWLAHTGLRTVSSLAPGRLLGQFDWLYNHDVTQAG